MSPRLRYLSYSVYDTPTASVLSRNIHFYPFKPDPCRSQNVRSALADAQRVISSSAPEAEKAEARIEVEVFEGLQAALSK
jgi:hypothetical protein